MVTVILIHVLGHLHILVNSLDLAIDSTEQILIIDWSGHQLQDLENLALEPRAGRHVVVIVLRIFLHVREDGYELRHQAQEWLTTKHLDGGLEKGTR